MISKYPLTILFFIIKVLDYISTKLNFSLVGDVSSEANPLMRNLFLESELFPILAILLVVLFISWVERRYKSVRSVQITILVLTLMNLGVVVSNFVTYYLGYQILK